MRNIKTLFLCIAVLGALPLLGFSCSNPLIQGVTFSIPPNLETAQIKLNFTNELQTDLGGSFPVVSGGRNYGTLEVDPTSPTSPFAVAFDLNLEILNDPSFNNLIRTNPAYDLPSGQPIPIPNLNRAMAQVKMANALNPNFDIYVYVDAADGGRQWVGLAMTLKFINNKYFPAGLALSQGFVKDKNGNNQVIAAVFGPGVDSSGHMTSPGGIALFANLKTLIAGGARSGKETKGSKLQIFEAPSTAPYYENHPDAVRQVGEAFKQLINANSYGRSTL
jgi:hypothetical protein